MRRYWKIWALGDKYTDGIFNGPVSIQEKVDGSQLNVSSSNKEGLQFLTNKSSVSLGDGNKMFSPVVEYFHSIEDRLVPDWTYHGEAITKTKHNTLNYERVPKGFFVLWGVSKPDGTLVDNHGELTSIANTLGVDVIPELFYGVIDPTKVMDMLEEMLQNKSFLGNEFIEGVVIKRFGEEFFVAKQLQPLMQAKFVSSQFKERHKIAWPNSNKGPLVLIGEMVRTEARWLKAIQKHKESGAYEGNPRDIGPLMKLLNTDIDEEDKEELKEQLWKAFSKDIKRSATKGFPEFFKALLIKEQEERHAAT
jgi:hypothetical protein